MNSNYLYVNPSDIVTSTDATPYGTVTTTPYNVSLKWKNSNTGGILDNSNFKFKKVDTTLDENLYILTTDFAGYVKEDIKVEVVSDGVGWHHIEVEAENEDRGKKSWSHKLRKRYEVRRVHIRDGVLVFHIRDDPNVVQIFEVE